MVKYVSLSLKGFGCFGAAAEFYFDGHLDTYARLNETGKSTMMNGLVHTIFGMRKQEKQRFMSWSGVTDFKGQLTIGSSGTLYRISMDFARDRVMVSRAAGKNPESFENHIAEQQHVPAGTVSQAYLKFLQDVFGTSDIDIFKAAFVVEQPMKGDLKIGSEDRLILDGAGGSYDNAVRKLIDRLGKDEKGITMHIDEIDPFSSPQRKPRLLELKLRELEGIKEKIAKSEETLDSVFPLTDRYSKVKGEIDALKKGIKDIGVSLLKLDNWLRMRRDFDEAAAKERNRKEAISRIKTKIAELDKAISDERALSDGYKGEPVENSLIDGVQKAAASLESLLSKADEIFNRYSGEWGSSSGLHSIDPILEGAEEEFIRIAEGAARKSSRLREGIALAAQWKEQFKPVIGVSAEEAGSWRAELESLYKRKANFSISDFGIWRAILLSCASVAAIFGIATIYRGFDISKLMPFAIALILFIASFFAKGGRKAATGRQAAGGEEELKGKIRLYEMMVSSSPQSLPDDAEDQAGRLQLLSEDAMALARLSSGAAIHIRSMDEEKLDEIGRISTAGYLRDPRSIAGLDGDFWEGVKKENASRQNAKKALKEAQDKRRNLETVAGEMIKSQGAASIEELELMATADEMAVRSRYSAWEAASGGETALAPDVNLSKIAEIDTQIRLLKEEEAAANLKLEALEKEADELKGELIKIKADEISNIPEMRERASELDAEIKALRDETEVIGIALREIRAAGEGFANIASESLSDAITKLLYRVTGIKDRIVKVNSQFELSVEIDGRPQSLEQLSQGTKDQMLICMRIAAAELLGAGREVPIFFDDSFGTTDSRRLQEIRGLLTELSKKRQFIVLSHSEGISDWGTDIESASSNKPVTKKVRAARRRKLDPTD